MSTTTTTGSEGGGLVPPSLPLPQGVRLLGPVREGYGAILTPEALAFVAALQRAFGARRQELLAARRAREARLAAGELPTLLPQTRAVREDESWQVAPAPADLLDRRVEITGPVDRKMMINALNSGASVFMADLEDSCAPTWANVVEGQQNLHDAVRRTLRFAQKNKTYVLDEAKLATLVVRPRGWHLEERHLEIDGEPCSASLFDFGLYFFHNARELVARGSGPYFYLPKLESHLEARLWNEVFVSAQEALGLPRGTVRATVLIENILAAFEMEEILYELREHMAGLNAGRWDYIFSAIKKFRGDASRVLPQRSQITMTVPFMRAYTERLVKTCHRRGAHAIGGMSAFIPSRSDARINELAIARVREDKLREAADGFDGTWVAHPDLVAVARSAFDPRLGTAPHQKQARRDEPLGDPAALIDFTVPGGEITREGVATNIDVAIQYLAYWLSGVGAAAIHNLMEDAATAEISRAQLWQWLRHQVTLSDTGERFDAALYRRIRDRELAELRQHETEGKVRLPYDEAAQLLDELVLDTRDFADFLTLVAYPRLTD